MRTCRNIAGAMLVCAAASIVQPAFAAKMSGNYTQSGRDDSFGCRAKVRAEMGIARYSGSLYPDFGPRVRKCVQANLGGSVPAQQQTATRTVAQPPSEQARPVKGEKPSPAREKAANRVSRSDTADLSSVRPTSEDQFKAPNATVDLGKRIALVIGNGGYEQVPVLPNPPRDAGDMGEALKRLGFQVTFAKDLNLEQTRNAIAEFGRAALDSEIALVFYAGHGVEAYGENWMIPVDARIRADGDMRSEAINLKTLSAEVAKARSLGLIILDACRDNPFTTSRANVADVKSEIPGETLTRVRSVSKGLAPTEPSGNVLIAFAAKDGTVANDGDGRNSPFTAALLKHVETPGLEVTFLFRRVRDDVMSATNGLQQPYVYGSLSRTEIFLKPSSPKPLGSVTR
jgi:Caspase domain